MSAPPCSPAPASSSSSSNLQKDEDAHPVTTLVEVESHPDSVCPETTTTSDDDNNKAEHHHIPPSTEQSQSGLDHPPIQPLSLPEISSSSGSGSGSGSGSNIPNCSDSTEERATGAETSHHLAPHHTQESDHQSHSTSLTTVTSASCSSSSSTSSSLSASSAPTTVSVPASTDSAVTAVHDCPSAQQPEDEAVENASSSPSSSHPPTAETLPQNHTPETQDQLQEKQPPQHQQQDRESLQRYLDKLKETVSKAELGNILSRESDSFHQAVLELYMERFDFRKDPIDLALRKFLLDYHFPKEAQQIDRVLQAFANRYHACNPNLFRSADIVYTLSFSLMLLHTDAHNKNVRSKMTKEQYIKQAKSIEGVSTIPADILEGSITQLSPDLSDLIPYRWPYYWKGTIELVDNVQINNQFTKAPTASIPGLRCREASTSFESQPFSPQAHRAHSHQLSTPDRINSPVDTIRTISFDHPEDGGVPVTPTSSTDIEAIELKVVKHGILSRKIDLENGKKSTVRGWRELGVILCGSQLLFFTDLSWFHQQRRHSHGGFNPEAPPEVDGYFAAELVGNPPSMPQALISTHDSIAVVDSTYQKYPHVFRLVCPNGKQYLFRAENEREMNDWMSKINYATAFKTAGVRLRNYRVAWADDVVWIRDDQGRYQLRRRRKKTNTEDLSQEQQNIQQRRQQFDEGRAELIKSKLKDIDNLIHSCATSLANELRHTRNLEVMIPLQPSTRQRIILSATEAGKRLRNLMLERTKLDCYRTILERDLAVVVAPTALNLSYWSMEQRHADGHSAPTTATAFTSESPLGGSRLGTPLGSSTDPQREWIQECVKTALRQGSGSPLSASEKDPSGVVPSINAKSPRPKLSRNDLARTVSESVLDEHHRHQRAVTVDFPQGPAAIQAAIIDAARGGSGLITSPDSNVRLHDRHHERHHSAQEQSTKVYRNTIMIPRVNQASSTVSHSPSNTAPSSPSTPVAPSPVSVSASAPNATMASTPGPKPEVGSPGLLSPNTVPASSRSRALSLPQGAQRPPALGSMGMTMQMPRTVSIYSSSSQTASRLKKILEQGLSHFKRRGKKDTKADSIVSHAAGSTPSVSSSGSSISNGVGGATLGQSSSVSQLHQSRVSTSLSLSRTSSSIGSLREWSSASEATGGGPLGESLLPVRPSIGSINNGGGETLGSRSGTPRIQMISRWDSDDSDDEVDAIGVEDMERDNDKDELQAENCSDAKDKDEGHDEQIVVSPPSPPSTTLLQLNLNLGSEIDLLPASMSLTTDSKDDPDSPTLSPATALESSQVAELSLEDDENQEAPEQHEKESESGLVSTLQIPSVTVMTPPFTDQSPATTPSPLAQVSFDVTIIDGDD
ncbi:hypothetical protein BGW41_002321 [Actinomortierella wolfii]|nr:hypothetical protein BGW41_002321 [Actinomortierella wolfii]